MLVAPAAVTPPAAVPHVRAERPDRTPRPARPEVSEAIGVSGERLTRDEAFDLLRRTVAALTSGDAAVRASIVRSKARDVLGRDSESLSDRNFPRILKDAHDNDVIDLRRRGDDFEVARVSEAESVAEQLAKTAISNAPAAALTAPAPRGMGPRGGGSSRGRVGRPGAPPADLLSIGVVGQSTSAAPAVEKPATAAANAPAASAAPAAAQQPAAARKAGRKTAAKKSAPVAKSAKAAPDTAPAKPAGKAAAKGKAKPATKAAAKPRAKKTVARSNA
ncbi:MAG: hypothetical protein ABJA80_09405 [bacterium]